MNSTTCSTHACTIEELNTGLKTSMRVHGEQHHLDDIESEVLMCCETESTIQKNGLFGGKETTQLSAVYVTPKWLVWATAENGKTSAGSAQLRQFEARNYETTAMFASVPNQGLNITGRYTDTYKTGITFISLGSEPDGQNFRQVLKEALSKASS
jgi:hypothetical protein